MNILAQTPNFNANPSIDPTSTGAPSVDELMSGLRPIKPVVDLPVEPEVFSYAPIIWGVIGIIVLSAVSWWIWKNRSREEIDNSEQNALSSLDKLVEQDLDNSDFVLKVSHVLKRYLEEKKLFAAVRQTTEEFLLSLKNSEKMNEHRDSLKAFFEQCDLVKFACGDLAAEQRGELVENVRTLVKDIAQSESLQPESTNI